MRTAASGVSSTLESIAFWATAAPDVGDLAGGPAEVSFSSASDGIVDGDGTIWTTADAGARWQRRAARLG